MNPKFTIYTGLLKAFDGPDGEKRFRTTASSTITDLAKDEITPAAIEKMAEKAKGNLTIFLNHEYRVPEDVLGSVDGVLMQTRGVDSEANPIVDLDFDIKLNQANPRALQTWEAIKAGTKLGTSIGALVRHAEKKKGGGLRIDDLELLEASIVGIPANPRSWVQYAMKSLAAIEGSENSAFVIDEESVIKELPEDEIVTEEVAEKAACPDCGKGKGAPGCGNAYHKAAPEPEVTETEPDKEARTRVTVTVDNESAQEAPKSGPESALMDEDRADTLGEPDNESLGDSVTHSAEPEVEKTEEPDKAADLDTDTADLTSIVTKFQTAVTRIIELEKKVAEVEAERDTAKENFAAAKEIVEKIADLPIGRKTQFSGPVNDFRKRFAGTYDDEFIKFLEK